MAVILPPIKELHLQIEPPPVSILHYRDIAAICLYEVMHDLATVEVKPLRTAFVGSSYIKQTLTNDLDILVHLPSAEIAKLSHAVGEGQVLNSWMEGGSFDNEDLSDELPAFRSYRFGHSLMDGSTPVDIDVNVIAVNTQEEFDRFKQAADICRLLQFCDKDIPKDLRIDIHKMVRYSMTFDELMEEKGLT